MSETQTRVPFCAAEYFGSWGWRETDHIRKNSFLYSNDSVVSRGLLTVKSIQVKNLTGEARKSSYGYQPFSSTIASRQIIWRIPPFLPSPKVQPSDRTAGRGVVTLVGVASGSASIPTFGHARQRGAQGPRAVGLPEVRRDADDRPDHLRGLVSSSSSSSDGRRQVAADGSTHALRLCTASAVRMRRSALASVATTTGGTRVLHSYTRQSIQREGKIDLVVSCKNHFSAWSVN
jgi:hypothetical protein